MAKLDRLMIEKEVLQALPEGELAILLGGGKVLNELNMSTKYLMFCTNVVRASENGPDKTAAFTALSFFLRILAGHVFESYQFFQYLQKVVRFDELRKSKSGRLDATFDADIKRLKTYFGRINVILKMRNQFSFHTDPALLLSPLRAYRPSSRTTLYWVRSIEVTISSTALK